MANGNSPAKMAAPISETVSDAISQLAAGTALRLANADDAPAIAALVNRAYRPAADQGGWTHESHLVSGARISATQVARLLQTGALLVLSQQQEIVACVHVACVHVDCAGTPESGIALISMLATEPQLQGQGSGKQMLQCAETYAANTLRASVFKLHILSARPELLAFYQRRGYQPDSETQPYPTDANVGVPKAASLQVLTLRKHAPHA